MFEGNNEDNNTTATATPLIFDVPAAVGPDRPVDRDPRRRPSRAARADQWTVQNIGANPAAGSWTDTRLPRHRRHLGHQRPPDRRRSRSPARSPPGGTYTSTLNANLPAAAAGQYRVIVRTNIFDDVVESNYLNNTTASADVVTRHRARACTWACRVQTTLSTGQDQLYEVQVGLGQTLRVDLTSSDASASNELYLRYKAVPTGTQYDAVYQGALQANQFAVIPSTQAGEYLVLVRGQSEPAANTPVTIVANVLPFEITDVEPDEGGDGQYVTTTILGAQFDPQAIVKLVRPGIAEYEPVSYQVVDSTKIIAIFDLTNAPHGLYDVEVINPDGADGIRTRIATWSSRPCRPMSRSALGGPRVLTAGQTGPLRLLAPEHDQRQHPLRRFPGRHPRAGRDHRADRELSRTWH